MKRSFVMAFAALLVLGGTICVLFAIETTFTLDAGVNDKSTATSNYSKIGTAQRPKYRISDTLTNGGVNKKYGFVWTSSGRGKWAFELPAGQGKKRTTTTENFVAPWSSTDGQLYLSSTHRNHIAVTLFPDQIVSAERWQWANIGERNRVGAHNEVDDFEWVGTTLGSGDDYAGTTLASFEGWAQWESDDDDHLWIRRCYLGAYNMSGSPMAWTWGGAGGILMPGEADAWEIAEGDYDTDPIDQVEGEAVVTFGDGTQSVFQAPYLDLGSD